MGYGDTGRAAKVQGAGHALLTQVITNHVERGATLFYLMASEAGFPLYQRIGFQTVANPVVWVMEHAVQVGALTIAKRNTTAR